MTSDLLNLRKLVFGPYELAGECPTPAHTCVDAHVIMITQGNSYLLLILIGSMFISVAVHCCWDTDSAYLWSCSSLVCVCFNLLFTFSVFLKVRLSKSSAIPVKLFFPLIWPVFTSGALLLAVCMTDRFLITKCISYHQCHLSGLTSCLMFLLL